MSEIFASFMIRVRMMDFVRSAASGSYPATILRLLVIILSLTTSIIGANTQYVTGVDAAGTAILLLDDRRPALYTQNFGDCLGSSAINVTRFDAAYYKDNMTVLFHLEGTTGLVNESLMLYIGVFAYGESRFDLTFNPCGANIKSLCPANSSLPIEANGIIPVSQNNVAGIPPIALSIPDFEGQAILRIFSNATETEIGCYSAAVTNGFTFSHPAAVGSVLGIFTFIALLASAVTAIYGNHLPTMRSHYAHSLSIFVVFSVFQHIFFTGVLSMNWPSVLPAFWSNFAWSAGMIYSQKMQDCINQFIGSNRGNISIVGAAASGASADGLGGGYSISDIYKRTARHVFHRNLARTEDWLSSIKSRTVEHTLRKRVLANATDGYSWYGKPVAPGLPLPGNYSGFAGALSEEDIPASNAFMTAFLWLLILAVIIAASVVAFKWTLEGLSRTKLMRNDRLEYFRAHWIGFTAIAVMRTLFIAFFSMMLLTLFQFTFRASAGVTAIAAIIFVIFLFGSIGIAGYACFYRFRSGQLDRSTRSQIRKKQVCGFLPWYELHLDSHKSDESQKAPESISQCPIPWWKIPFVDTEDHLPSVHDDEDYNKKFGWLSARFRRTRWWFFAPWLLYEFIRACFYGGAAGHPLTQVFGLLIVEFIALVAIVALKPFEGARLNAIMVYVLGFSKVATVALSAAFDPRFNLQRITTTVIGIVIIVIQGILTIVLMLAIVVGAVSSYMSVTRNREDFRPRKWAPYRERYFAHIEKSAQDVPPPPPPVPEEPKGPYFNVASVRRCPKIEDEDNDAAADVDLGKVVSGRASRANSMQSLSSHTNVPYGARVHRASWSTRDFNSWSEANARRQDTASRNGMRSMKSAEELVQTPSRAPSRNGNPISPGPSRMPSRDGTPLSISKMRGAKGKEKEIDEVSNEDQE